MSNLIQSAAKGQRKAIKQLYEANKQKVYYVAKCLLGNSDMATEAAFFAFNNVWSEINSQNISTEEEFTNLLIRKTVDYCMKNVNKVDTKAFRIPNGRNFNIPSDSTISKDAENVSEEVLCKLPALQRFIFVLHTVGDYLPEQIASTFKFDKKTANMALDTEKTNIERLTSHLGSDYSYEAIVEKIRNEENKTKVPSTLDERVEKTIDLMATPTEKKNSKRTIIIISIIVGILLIAGIVLLVTRNTTNKNSSIDDSQTTSNTNKTTNKTSSSNDNKKTSDTNEAKTTVISEPVIELDETLTYYADIQIAGYGNITVKLDQEAAPVTVSNFINLAQNGFYDGLTFHRIMEGFMMQGGDPNGNGTGGNTDENGNEINIVGEFTVNGYENNLSHTRGAISMARAIDYNSASSQFFIVQKDSTHLDGQYAVFGYVTDGLDVVDSVCVSAEPIDNNGTIETNAQPIITSITIRTE